ncbi:MAG TPA: dTMP kinase [Rudaea sp.]|jgi:dTMP kinase|uniref:dTMP kinase n=1 Tax=Rudaea sp. TaxID=2136325 RepID=UPI002F92607F
MKGKLITLEGGEGAGKSTVLDALRTQLAQHGIDAVVTREPGGTPVGEAIRSLLLDPARAGLCAETELLLMFASRAQLVRELVEPALAAGRWVLSDRFTDASFAYQGGGRGQPLARIAELERWAAAGVRPDLTLLLDLPVDEGLARVRGRGPADRIEMENAHFFENVRDAYRARAVADPARFRVIDSSRPLAYVLAQVHDVVAAFLDANGAARAQGARP